MRDKDEQASAYLREAETTLEAARVLHESDPDRFAPQVVKNAYDALEQALSAGVAERGEDVPRGHGAKIQRFFSESAATEAEERSFYRHSRRSRAQYVDFEGADLAVPSDRFDREDADRILEDARSIVRIVRYRIDVDE